MNFKDISNRISTEQKITKNEALYLLSEKVDAIDLLSLAYPLRKKYYDKSVRIHILNNSQNGYCPEDCHYCVQAKDSKVPIEKYTKKDEDQILKEAENAYKKGAYRYCMVFSGRGPSKKRVEFLSGVIKRIKENFPIEVCLSPGLISKEDAKHLADAGLDRYNHNLNTSESNYENICTTHTFKDRLDTLSNVHENNIDICSGMIVGMGETDEDIVSVAQKLKELNVKSIPINFYLHMEGNKLGKKPMITPEKCCKIVAMFRCVHPNAEIRLAAGREHYLKHLQPMALMAANSLFMNGYLNIKGSDIHETIYLIESSGYSVASDVDLSSLKESAKTHQAIANLNDHSNLKLKSKDELIPA
ncbi:MAG: biotin synthase BioB [Candidatus Margulisiibacteriota bacterium]